MALVPGLGPITAVDCWVLRFSEPPALPSALPRQQLEKSTTKVFRGRNFSSTKTPSARTKRGDRRSGRQRFRVSSAGLTKDAGASRSTRPRAMVDRFAQRGREPLSKSAELRNRRGVLPSRLPSALHARTRCMEFDQVSGAMNAALEDVQRQHPEPKLNQPSLAATSAGGILSAPLRRPGRPRSAVDPGGIYRRTFTGNTGPPTASAPSLTALPDLQLQSRRRDRSPTRISSGPALM